MLTLRTKLIGAFALVIFLSLLLAGSAFVLLLREYQTQREISRLADLALPVSFQVRALERQGATAAELSDVLERMAEELRVRIVLVDPSGHVLSDTGRSLVGQQVQLPRLAQSLGTGNRPVLMEMSLPGGGERVFLAVPPPRTSPYPGERFLSPAPWHTVALVVPESRLAQAWMELGPRLAVAGLLSLLVSIGVALFLSNSIAGPLRRITRASEEMARGNYEQVIPVQGRDEVGRLAAAFNAMAREVARSHRTLRDFLADVSHELRTPLTSVQGFSQAMAEGALHSPDEYAEAGRIIHEEAGRMQRLVDDLLYLSRIESGQIVLEKEPVDAGELARAALRRLERRAAEAAVQLVLDVGVAPSIVGDSRRLEQVLDNLLDNALRHTPPGGTITVRVALTGNSPSGLGSRNTTPATVEIVVHNTGSTIPPDDLERIFERFYSRSPGRSGLGLAIAREMVEAHGGKLVAYSSAEKGTEFVVSLPGMPAQQRSP